MTDPQARSLLHRRTIAGVASVGLALPVLAACSGNGSVVATDPNPPSPSPDPTTSRAPSEPSSPSVDAFARTSDIKVGGGTIYPDDKVVITQPVAGEFRCFSAVCTHQGCIVSSVADGGIHCECHGSAFSIEDGSVVNGPATKPLIEEQIQVQGDAITLG